MISNSDMVMPVAPAYSGFGGGSGFGGDWSSWIILFLIFAMFGNGGWGGNNGGANGNTLYPWLNQSNQVNDGFRDQMMNSAISSIQNVVTAGFGDVQNSLCNGFASINAAINGAQMNSLERSFAAQTANTQGINALQAQLASCCCENRLATANLGADIAREACANRTNDTQNTQSVLAAINGGIQSIKDQLCNDKIDAKNEKIADLERQLSMAALRESQTAQNALISQGFSNEVDALYNRLNSCPVPTTPVYGRTPIFTCNQSPAYNGCGCGCGVA